MDAYKLFIDGEFVEAQNGETFGAVDPGTGAVFAQVARVGTADAEAAIGALRSESG
jgi:aldehyde dehydrogenase (NAD+)